MRIRSKVTSLALASGLAVAGFAGLATPAHAAQSGSTIATFAITAGSLNIVVPASTVALGTGTINTGAPSASATLGSVSVTDTRGALVGNWSTGVSSTNFVTGTSTANETVAAASIAYSAGAATATTGTGVFAPLVIPALATSAAPGATYAGVGNNSATWNPTLTFTLGAQQVAGTYTGTVTHSVA
ncbi:MAG TPA: hypothetical protein VM121_00050 [Acidimicrobiales bacterium]|nr:hypothetical protein [Acidimicrobiales bacterium]